MLLHNAPVNRKRTLPACPEMSTCVHAEPFHAKKTLISPNHPLDMQNQDSKDDQALQDLQAKTMTGADLIPDLIGKQQCDFVFFSSRYDSPEA